MEKADVIDIVINVLQTVIEMHADQGRHEINRTDLAKAIDRVKAVGLPDNAEVKKLF